MIKSKIIDLINRHLDGELNEKEEAYLKAYLQQDKEVLQFFKEQERMITYLNAVPEVDPPADLKKAIMSGINVPVDTAHEKVEAPVFALRHWFRQEKLRVILTHAAVLIIGFGLSAYLIHSSDPQDVYDFSQLSGTIGLERQVPAMSEFVQSIELQKLKGHIDVRQYKTQAWIIFDISAATACSTHLLYDPALLHFQAFMPSHTEIISLEKAENALSIQSSGSYLLLFNKIKKQPSVLQIEISDAMQEQERFEIIVNQR